MVGFVQEGNTQLKKFITMLFGKGVADNKCKSRFSKVHRQTKTITHTLIMGDVHPKKIVFTYQNVFHFLLRFFSIFFKIYLLRFFKHFCQNLLKFFCSIFFAKFSKVFLNIFFFSTFTLPKEKKNVNKKIFFLYIKFISL
jgi:hypothetical protein